MAAPDPAFPQYQLRNIVDDIFTQLGLLIRLERKMLGLLFSYAVAIGMFLLCVPIAVDRKSTRLNSSHSQQSRMPSSA